MATGLFTIHHRLKAILGVHISKSIASEQTFWTGQLENMLAIQTYAGYEIRDFMINLLTCFSDAGSVCWKHFYSSVWDMPVAFQKMHWSVRCLGSSMVKGNVPLSNYINYKLPLRGAYLYSRLCSPQDKKKYKPE